MPAKPRKIRVWFDGKEYEVRHLRLNPTNFSFETLKGKKEWFIHPIGKIKINIEYIYKNPDNKRKINKKEEIK